MSKKVLIITGDGGDGYEALYAYHRFLEARSELRHMRSPSPGLWFPRPFPEKQTMSQAVAGRRIPLTSTEHKRQPPVGRQVFVGYIKWV